MRIIFLFLIHFIGYAVQAQINLPIQKSPTFKYEQKKRLVREQYQGLIAKSINRSGDSATIKTTQDSLRTAEKFDIAKIDDEARSKAAIPYRVLFGGLGNFAASQSGDEISPSANIFISSIPFRSPNLKLSMLINLGVNLDSSNIDSLKLGHIFFPDKTKTGFSFRLSYDVFPLLINWFRSELISFKQDDDGYTLRDNIEPYIEYNYNKFNFRKANPDSSNLQTNTFQAGISYSHSWEKEENTFGFIVTPYYRSVKLTDGTYTLYKKIFNPSIDPDKNPQTVKFIGINTSLQINRFMLSFIWENLKTKALSGSPVDGGVFTIKASVTGDFLKL